jgi:hypothetical protein
MLAPLGTDKEAAGSPVSRQAVASAQREPGAHAREIPHRRGLGHAWILIAFVLLLAITLIAWAVIGEKL